jgi:hypothetical protein
MRSREVPTSASDQVNDQADNLGRVAPHAKVDRRALLRLGAAAAALGAGSLALKPNAAAATTAGMQLGAENDAANSATGVTSSNGTDTLHVTNTNAAPAVEVRSGGAGLLAFGAADAGVVGITRGVGPGVRARADIGTGPALRAEVDAAAATTTTIEAAQSGQGIGVLAHIDNTTSNARAVVASTRGLGQAHLAAIANASSKAAAMRAQTTGFGSAVDAASALGAGGRFSGKTAQIQLVPSNLSTHPPSGSAGQLFVDRSNRLWYCKGGTAWHQLA